jgi:polyisoprenoid-binding protein YceI
MNWLLALVMILSCDIAIAGTWIPRVGSTNQVTWEAQGFPGFLRINGEGGKVRGEAKISYGSMRARFRVDLSKFKTGLSLRDSHMHDKYLETGKFKWAILEIPKISSSDGSQFFKGTLEIKNQTRPVKGEIKITSKGKLKHVEASFTMLIEDFSRIGIPSYAGITMAEKVGVDVKFILVEK